MLFDEKYLKLGELVRLQSLPGQDPLYHRLGYLDDGSELEEIITESVNEVQHLVLKCRCVGMVLIFLKIL